MYRFLSKFAAALCLCVGFLALSRGGELKPALLYNYELVELPDVAQLGGLFDIKLLDNGAILLRGAADTLYRKADGEWIAPPRSMKWTVDSSNGVVGGFDNESSLPAIWHPEDGDTGYTIVSDDAYGPLGVSDSGAMLLMNDDTLEILYWRDGDLRLAAEAFPALGIYSTWLRFLLSDGTLYGFTKPTPTTFAPFTFTPDEFAIHSEFELDFLLLLDLEFHSPSGNVFSVDKDTGVTLWGPAFESVISLQLPGFSPEAVNDRGELVGTREVRISALEMPMYWSSNDGFLDLNDLIVGFETSAVPPHFHQAVSINSEGSILAFGLVKTGSYSSVSKLYLLSRAPAENRIGLSFEFEPTNASRITAIPHFQASEVVLEGSSDLNVWEPVAAETAISVGPRYEFEVSPQNRPAYLRVRATPAE